MSDCENSLWNPDFSHIYVEDEILAHPGTAQILSHFPHASILTVSHYKEVFCRKNQEFAAQKERPQLILAKKKDSFLYKGSLMCDSFGNENFYYSSDMMNCVYQCEYCYLQGMYPSANLVVFVNLEDTLYELEIHLREKPMYVCISYDTDLLALENWTGFVAEWIRFASLHPTLTIELRTKSANFTKISTIPAPQNFILAWSLSPSWITDTFEHRTPRLRSRLQSMRQAIEKGWKVRLCVDPMIRIDQWEAVYGEFFREVRDTIPLNRLYDFSIGVFRVPKDSLKTMRTIQPGSSLLAYPFSLTGSGWSYPEEQEKEMTDYLKNCFVEEVRSVKH